LLGSPLVKVSEDPFPGWDVRAVCAAVVAGVRFHLGDEVVFVRGEDRFLAALAVDADGHFYLLRVGESGWSRTPARPPGQWLRTAPRVI
jgi:hypothetical protein